MSIVLIPLAATVSMGQRRPDPATVSVVYHVRNMERATVRRDVIFDRSTPTPLALDAYLPRGLHSGEQRPAIVFVSGAERVRSWSWFVSWGRIAAAHGFVGIVPDKRYPRGLEGIRSGFEDTLKLFEYLKAPGGQLNVDPD